MELATPEGKLLLERTVTARSRAEARTADYAVRLMLKDLEKQNLEFLRSKAVRRAIDKL